MPRGVYQRKPKFGVSIPVRVQKLQADANEALRRKLDNDPVNHPSHYTTHPSGVECITITQHHNFAVGNAIKYLWRAGLKDNAHVMDLEKAVWYINKEIERITT